MMDDTPQTWEWKCPAPVRADADSVFVPCAAVPGARVGDIVVVESESGDETRTGTITATSQGDDELFFRVALER